MSSTSIATDHMTLADGRARLSRWGVTTRFLTVGLTIGLAALEKLRVCERPCLVLLDMMTPLMNGLDFLEAVRTRKAGDVLLGYVRKYCRCRGGT